MTSDEDVRASAGELAAPTSAGPPRLRPIASLLRSLPVPVAEALLAATAVSDAAIRRDRWHRVVDWTAARGARGLDRYRLALAVLANHGRFVAYELRSRVESPHLLHRDVALRGEDHLRTLRGGALLLGFHLGPPKNWIALRNLGYPVRFAGRLALTGAEGGTAASSAADDPALLSEGPSPERLRALYKIRNLLLGGEMIYINADGRLGREAFRIDLAGCPLIARVGWFALRRTTAVPTLPVLSHMEGRRQVIEIHPPLPPPEADAARDAAACQAFLTPLIEAYVRQYPSQCRWLALRRYGLS